MSMRMRTAGKIAITPFWNRMPRFFLYPLTIPAILVLFVLAFLNGFLLDLAATGTGGMVLAALVSFVAGLFSIKYGYDILERTAHGQLHPPALNREVLLEGYELPFKQIAVFIVVAAVAMGLFMLWPPLAFVHLALFLLLLPAIVMTLAIERSLSAALNPGRLFSMAYRIGWPYLAVLALVVLLNGGSATVLGLFGQGLPNAALAFVNAFAQNFFWFVIMNLMGYLIYQYHGRVGFEPEAVAGQDDGWGELLEPVQENIDAGHYDTASEQLGHLMREYPDHEIALRQRRHQLLRLADRESAMVQNAGSLMAQLIDANRIREATEVYIDLTDIDPDLRPGREGDYEPLMHMLVQRGEYKRAVRMANGFHKAFPDSDAVPPLYLEVARLFSERLGQPEKARGIADFLLKHFPEHPVADRARVLRDALTN